MSSLREIDRRYLEQLLGMARGLVLDFTDATFAAFLRDYGPIDIHSERYVGVGTSKANKLREFWRIEADDLVGIVLRGLIEHWVAINPRPDEEGRRLVARCAEIAERLIAPGVRIPNDETTTRIWGPSGYRVFLSHKSEIRAQTARLKEELAKLGIAAFVAHEDIEPTRLWQDEIESALASMDAFVALMTEDYHDSAWTDQEVGYAYAIRVPLIAVRLGKDPYGFIGRFQALSCGWAEASIEIAKILVRQAKMVEAFVEAAKSCRHFGDGNRLAQLLPQIGSLSNDQVRRLIEAFNGNYELQGSFGFNGQQPRYHGPGLVDHLNRITGRRYRFVGPGGDLRIDEAGVGDPATSDSVTPSFR